MNAIQGTAGRQPGLESAVAIPRPAATDDRALAERAGIALVLVTCVAMFMLVAVVGALLGLNWRAWLPGAEGHATLFGSVRGAAYSVLPLLG